MAGTPRRLRTGTGARPARAAPARAFLAPAYLALALLLAPGALAPNLFDTPSARADEQTGYARERAAMIRTLRAYGRGGPGLSDAPAVPEDVLAVMGRVPRHLFVPEAERDMAYANRPLPIGRGQTISQPYIVALMTALAAPKADHTVLEIGAGSGYQAAVLAGLARQVCTIEIVPALGEAAAARLKRLGFANVRVRVGDGYRGWPECGPFDSVVVTAALGHVPPPLVEQLKVGGRLVMPVGEPGEIQQLTVLEKTAPGKTTAREVTAVQFVPFIRPRP